VTGSGTSRPIRAELTLHAKQTEASMTDPDLIFDLDPANVQRVEAWLAELCPDTAVTKDADGSRLTWKLDTPRGTLAHVVATESFLSMPPAAVERLLHEAQRVCDDQPDASPWYLLLTVDGVRAVEVPPAA
jgi:hypothetical protein